MKSLSSPFSLSADVFAPLPNFSMKVLLVDDQLIIGEALKRQLIDQKDILLHTCMNPLEAEALTLTLQPTVILLDLVMPELDGLSLLKKYRENQQTKDIPIIVLSVEENPRVKAEAFALGANDYIVKLPDKLELIARIRYHSLAYIRLLERNAAYQKLEENQQILHKELSDAAAYVISLFPEPFERPFKVDWRFIPSMQLGGDAFGYHWLDDHCFALYLLDVCGHGVGAALHSISVVNTLRSGNLLNADFYKPTSVLRELNNYFQMEDHNNMFLTIWYGVFDTRKNSLTFSNGGHPPAVVMNPAKKELNGHIALSTLTTPGMAVGISSDATFYEDTYQLEAQDDLLIFSDGVFEILKNNGTVMSYSEFAILLTEIYSKPGSFLDTIIRETKHIQGSNNYLDDFSIVQLTV